MRSAEVATIPATRRSRRTRATTSRTEPTGRTLLRRREVEKMYGDALLDRAKGVDRRLLQRRVEPPVEFFGDCPGDPRVLLGGGRQRPQVDAEQAGRLERLHADID